MKWIMSKPLWDEPPTQEKERICDPTNVTFAYQCSITKRKELYCLIKLFHWSVLMVSKYVTLYDTFRWTHTTEKDDMSSPMSSLYCNDHHIICKQPAVGGASVNHAQWKGSERWQDQGRCFTLCHEPLHTHLWICRSNLKLFCYS